MRVTISNWKSLFGKALRNGNRGLDDAVALYLWARDHLTKLRLKYRGFTQEEVMVEIQRVWNINPEVYVRAACKLGGGEDQLSLEKGRAYIKRYGVSEIFRADRMIGTDQMVNLARRLSVSATAGPDKFREEVDREIQKLQEITPEKNGKKRPYKHKLPELHKRIAILEAQNARLREENKLLKRQLKWFERNVQVKRR